MQGLVSAPSALVTVLQLAQSIRATVRGLQLVRESRQGLGMLQAGRGRPSRLRFMHNTLGLGSFYHVLMPRKEWRAYHPKSMTCSY